MLVYLGGYRGDGFMLGSVEKTYGEVAIAETGGRGQDVKVHVDVDGLSGLESRVVVFCLLDGK